MTGKTGAFHTRQAVEYGTKVVAGVAPGKGGHHPRGHPGVQHRRREAVEKTGAKQRR